MQDFLDIHQLMTKSFEEIEALQEIKFKAIVHNLLPRVKFYKELFKEHHVEFEEINKVEDWKKKGLPLLKKSIYMKRPNDFIVKPRLKDHVNYLMSSHQTGGFMKIASSFLLKTTKKEMEEYYSPKMILFSAGTESGNPTPVMITKHQKHKILPELMSIIHEMMPNLRNKIGMNLFPYGPHLAWHSTHIGMENETGLNLCTAAGGAIRTEALVRLAKETKPTMIAGMSSYLRQKFLPECVKQKVRFENEVIFVNGAAKMHDAERQKIKELAKKIGVKKCHVLDFFGASEMKEDIMAECCEGKGFHHIAPLSNIIKTVKFETAEKDRIYDWDFSEEGYATIWNIDCGGTMLQGYLLGDKFSGIEKKRCPHCNLNVIRVKNIDRIRDVEAQQKLYGFVEAKVKGTKLNLSALRGKILELKGVQEIQIIAEKDKLKLNVVCQNKKEVFEKIKKIVEKLGITSEINKKNMEELEQGKIKFEGIIIKKT